MNYDALAASPQDQRLPAPCGEEIIYGGVHINKFALPKGMVVISHCHSYDHPSILAAGEVEVWTQANGVRKFTGPCEVKIPAGTKHAISALTDVVWYCIHAGTPEVSDPSERVA